MRKYSGIWRLAVLAALLLPVLIVVSRVSGVSVMAAPGTIPFTDNVEDPDSQNWLADAPWARTTSDSKSPSNSWADSPAGYYGNSSDVSLTLSSPLDLSSATNPQLKFWHHYSLESGFDFALVQVSTSTASGWNTIASYSGSVTSPFDGSGPVANATKDEGAAAANAVLSSPGEPWALEQLDLTDYAGEDEVLVRFRLITDGSVVNDGWYVDDIAVDELPLPVTNLTATGGAGTVNLDWTPSVDPDIAAYNIYRSESAGVDFDDTLVVSIANAAATGAVDNNLPPKTKFYYRVFAVSTSGIYSDSAEVSATTNPGLAYPFSDNMETSAANWVAHPSTAWKRVTVGNAHSGNNIWTDSVGANYANNTDVSLVLSDGLINTGSAEIVFWHKLAVGAGDTARLEKSTNGGSTWTQLTSFTNTTVANWTRVQVPVGAPATTTESFLIRFRLTSDSSGVADGWSIDDVSISNLPAAVALNAPVPQTPPNHDKITLSWSQSVDPLVQGYEVYMRTTAGITPDNATLLTTINNKTVTTYQATGLTPNTMYFFRVYVVNAYGVRNGSAELSGKTNIVGPVAFPYSDNMEEGVKAWTKTGTWAQTQLAAHSGTTSWTDSPGLDYANNSDTSLEVAVNLSGTVMPVLEFWHRYSFEQNADFGYVEVSINNGTTWNRVYFVTGGSASWLQELVDLAEYSGQANVRIRWRVVSNSGTTNDGWYVDDVSIAETGHAALPFPFFDDFETSTGPVGGNWITGSWAVTGPGNSGNGAITDSPNGNYIRGQNTHMRVISANTIDLSSADHPQLTFWQKYAIWDDQRCGWDFQNDRGRVYVSNFYGKAGTWQEVALFGGTANQWHQSQIDLSAFAGFSNVRVMFTITDDGNCGSDSNDDFNEADGWYLDDIRVQEAPMDVTLGATTGVTMHGATVNWSANTEPNFARYEIYRRIYDPAVANSPEPSRSDVLVATITNAATTSFNDTYTLLQPNRYRYKMFVVDTSGRYSVGSNTVEAVYTVPQVGFPFFDNMEGGASNWNWAAPWGQVTSTSFSGNTSWADSPLGSYGNSQNTSLDTIVSLVPASSPVLTFRHRQGMNQDTDFGHVEVSTDGGRTWTTLLRVTGTESWNQERVDLNAYRGGVIGLRFRFQSDASGVADGWYIDDVRIEDSPVTAAYPFFDNMESGLAPWKYISPWGQTDISAHSGSLSWTDSPGIDYPNNIDTSLEIAINLSGAVMPVLDFWQRYSFEQNADFGYIEVSTNNGASWNRPYFVTGGSATWVRELVDLTEYAGQANVRIRWRVLANSSNTTDGWYIDDVSINETSHSPIAFPLFDNFETSTGPVGGNWITGSWAVTGPGNSGTGALTDSPAGNYIRGQNTHMRVISANTIDLSGTDHPQLTFWQKYAIWDDQRCGWDFQNDRGRVYVSNFFGKAGTWQEVGVFGGTANLWHQAQIDLSAFAGFSNVRVMFTITDDGNCGSDSNDDFNESDGWYVDDIRIQEAPTDVTLGAPAGVTMHGATVSWSQNIEPSFARYEVYRKLNGDPTKADTLVATINSSGVTTHVDTYTLLQPSRFRYRVYVVDNLGRYSVGSNVVEAVYAVPQVAFPFFDDMESGTGNWNWAAPWGQVTSTAFSGQTAWADSPLGSYENNQNSSLDTRISLATAQSPVLTFWHKSSLETGADFGNVDISLDGGANWINLLRVTATENWNQERIDLNAYRGAVIGLRFRVQTNAAGAADGWYLDDIRVENSPVQASYPFFDDMESGLAPWKFQSPWGQTELAAHSGNHSWTDSPGLDYSNSVDTSLELNINMSGSVMPVLGFWHRYSFEQYGDFGYIEVSTDNGANWGRVYFVTGASASWIHEEVDMTAYAGQANVRIRWRVVSNGANTTDGWYVDDVSVAETTRPPLAYPFFDDIEASSANWITGSWSRTGPARSGTQALTDSPLGTYLRGTNSAMRIISANTIDLTGASAPKLSFWHKYAVWDDQRCGWDFQNDRAKVYVSNFFGKSGTWQEVGSYGGNQVNWVKAEIDLSAYAGFTNVRVMFTILDDGNCGSDSNDDFNESDGWWIDDIRIDASDTTAPSQITNLQVVSSNSTGVSLRWTATGDDGVTGAARTFDVRYLKNTPLTDANWATANLASGEPTPGVAGTIQDFAINGLDQNATYYFGVKALDEVDNAGALSNVVTANTFAAGTVQVKLGVPKEARPSVPGNTSTIMVMVNIDQVSNLNAADYTVTYDSNVLRLVGVDPGNINGTTFPVGAWNTTTPGTSIIAQDIAGNGVANGIGYLAILRFEVLSAAGTNSAIGVSNALLATHESTVIPSFWTGGTVQIVSTLSGDANGDGIVNSLDVTKIKRIIVQLDASTPGADANHDGSVNSLDLTRTKRIIVGLN